MADAIESAGENRFRECLGLCVCISGYIAVDVCGSTWPSDAAIDQMAKNVSRASLASPIDADELRAYLSKVVLGFQPLDKVFAEPGKLGAAPILMTAGLLLVFCPRGQDQWSYLDDIERAVEAAEEIPQPALPAVVLRAYRLKASK